MVGEYHVRITDWRAEVISIDDGSIVIRHSIIGLFVLELYGAVADHPSFREAVEIIIDDIKDVVSWLIYETESKRSPSDQRDPSSVHVYLNDEDDLAALIRDSS